MFLDLVWNCVAECDGLFEELELNGRLGKGQAILGTRQLWYR